MAQPAKTHDTTNFLPTVCSLLLHKKYTMDRQKKAYLHYHSCQINSCTLLV